MFCRGGVLHRDGFRISGAGLCLVQYDQLDLQAACGAASGGISAGTYREAEECVVVVPDRGGDVGIGDSVFSGEDMEEGDFPDRGVIPALHFSGNWI